MSDLFKKLTRLASINSKISGQICTLEKSNFTADDVVETDQSFHSVDESETENPQDEEAYPWDSCFLQFLSGEPQPRITRSRFNGFHVDELTYDAAYGSISILKSCKIGSEDIQKRFFGSAGPADYSPSDILFLDLETDGLGLGAKAEAWCVGIGRIIDGKFRILQIILEDPAFAQGQIEYAEAACREAKLIVTYNGVCFDVPRLAAQFKRFSLKNPLEGVSHLDIFKLIKSEWKMGRVWPPEQKFKLRDMEEALLDFHRVDDVPGKESSIRWRAYLQDRNPSRLMPMIKHNNFDILSLLGLMVVHLDEKAFLLDRQKPTFERKKVPFLGCNGEVSQRPKGETFNQAKAANSPKIPPGEPLPISGLDSLLRSRNLRRRTEEEFETEQERYRRKSARLREATNPPLSPQPSDDDDLSDISLGGYDPAEVRYSDIADEPTAFANVRNEGVSVRVQSLRSRIEPMSEDGDTVLYESLLLQLVALSPNNPFALRRLVSLYFALGDDELARHFQARLSSFTSL